METGYGYAAGWIAALGAGMGFVMPVAMGAAVNALDAERSGAGSAMMQALRQVGGTIGVAILGTVLSSGYRARLDLAGLPGPAAHAVRESAQSGAAVAHQLKAPGLLHEVRVAFVHGMDHMLWLSVGLAALGVVLAVLFLPRGQVARPVETNRPESTYEPV